MIYIKTQMHKKITRGVKFHQCSHRNIYKWTLLSNWFLEETITVNRTDPNNADLIFWSQDCGSSVLSPELTWLLLACPSLPPPALPAHNWADFSSRGSALHTYTHNVRSHSNKKFPVFFISITVHSDTTLEWEQHCLNVWNGFRKRIAWTRTILAHEYHYSNSCLVCVRTYTINVHDIKYSKWHLKLTEWSTGLIR